ncbi:hypothetical protein TSUD_140970 [Trifolium subterraneum]|uniref:RNase H type-1 domain-containing protein n=1 Tax=Trifolium subterraneum TaxID=3900 RepID=A0A2Z6PER3_TRISU|nr:hypothetical protein TSUD_140970 [Trifolium subterraneum]
MLIGLFSSPSCCIGLNESRQVRSEAGLREFVEDKLCNNNSVEAVLFDVCKNESAATAGNIAMIVWSIWFSRNNWVWDDIRETARDVAMRADHMIKEWRAVNLAQQAVNLSPVVTSQLRRSAPANPNLEADSQAAVQQRWQKPRDGWWKCNVDVSLSQIPGATGWGWCVRNSVGLFVAAGTNNCMHKYTAAEGEATTILEAMREAISRGWTNIVFESDSKVVVDAIQANSQGISELCSIISSIKLLLQCN